MSNDTAVPSALAASWAMSSGSNNSGGVASCTVMVNEPCALSLLQSSASQLTRVIPNGNVEPEAGVHNTAIFPSIGSLLIFSRRI
jgi:hypothetical protein